MTTKTHTGGYLKKMAEGGHFKQKLGETALALTECYCKADSGNRARLGSHLADQMFYVLRNVYGWDHNSCHEARKTVVKAFQNVDPIPTVKAGGGA